MEKLRNREVSEDEKSIILDVEERIILGKKLENNKKYLAAFLGLQNMYRNKIGVGYRYTEVLDQIYEKKVPCHYCGSNDHITVKWLRL